MTNQKANEIHIRPAKAGDICVLLEPAQKVEIDRLREYQLSFQSHFGGTPIDRIHLTCQRFASQDARQLEYFQRNLGSVLEGMEPFALTALSLQTIHSSIRQTNILKWRIEVTEELRQFVAVIEQTAVGAGMTPLYKSGFVSSLITALKDVPKLEDGRLAEYGGFPRYLYSGERIAISQINGPNEFKILAVFSIR